MISLALLAVLAPQTQSKLTYQCPIQGAEVGTPAETVVYKGVQYVTCCPGCGPEFSKDPDKVIAADAKKGWVIGQALFDPISGERIKPKDSTPNATYKGVRYFFATSQEKDTFLGSPAKFTKAPVKELLHCPVNDMDIASISAAAGYVDFKGVRYYLCCGDCPAVMKKDPAKYAAKFEAKATDAKPENVK